ncbi:MAG: hypothetical protein HQ522_11780 [Bacteroidetes bacterium]|nr:hypothetical protein [Bacteroidota bacterium]
MENLINLHESKFLIGMFDLQVWQMIKAKFIKYHYHKRNKTLRYMYKEMIKKEFGKYPSEARIQKFLNILTNNNDKLGVKYTNEKIVEAMKQV